MNERSKLLDVIRHYLSFDVEMDYMAVFASFLSSEDSSVRCACELLYYISSQEYPDLRQEIPVRNLVTGIKASLENGELIDESTLSSKIQNDPKLRILFKRANQESTAVRWFVYFIVTTLIMIAVVLVRGYIMSLESGKWRSAPGSYDEKLQGGYFGFTESTPSGTKEKGMDYEPF